MYYYGNLISFLFFISIIIFVFLSIKYDFILEDLIFKSFKRLIVVTVAIIFISSFFLEHEHLGEYEAVFNDKYRCKVKIKSELNPNENKYYVKELILLNGNIIDCDNDADPNVDNSAEIKWSKKDRKWKGICPHYSEDKEDWIDFSVELHKEPFSGSLIKKSTELD